MKLDISDYVILAAGGLVLAESIKQNDNNNAKILSLQNQLLSEQIERVYGDVRCVATRMALAQLSAEEQARNAEWRRLTIMRELMTIQAEAALDNQPDFGSSSIIYS